MASKTYKTRAVVLRKTKLGEKDLVVSLLSQDGSLLRAVAKGARKPGGSYSGRVELFNTIDLLLAKGRSLDVITDARLPQGLTGRSFELVQASSAAPIAELACFIAQEGLEHKRLFALVDSAFARQACADDDTSLKVCAAALWKVLAFSGFTPSFSSCIVCGREADLEGERSVPLSIADGGVVCGSCPRPSDAMHVDAITVGWCKALLYSTFDDVSAFNVDAGMLFACMQLARQWSREHVGKDVKSLDFLLTSGLF